LSAMSLIVTAFVPTGIVMSGDSRTTVTLPAPVQSEASSTSQEGTLATEVTQPATQIHTQVVLSDATYKVFLLFKRYGVSTCGAALIAGMPVAHHIEKFEQSQTNDPETTQALADALVAYFRNLNPIPVVWFHVAGYDDETPWIMFIEVDQNRVSRRNLNGAALTYSAIWNGDFDIAGRLGNAATARFAFDALNIQDAVDFSRHIIRTTIDQMRFELNFPTVGGPIDTLLITVKSSEFLLRKQIKCN